MLPPCALACSSPASARSPTPEYLAAFVDAAEEARLRVDLGRASTSCSSTSTRRSTRTPTTDRSASPATAACSSCSRTLAFLAGESETIRLGTGICLVPQRNPVYTAKEASTVDWLSKGGSTSASGRISGGSTSTTVVAARAGELPGGRRRAGAARRPGLVAGQPGRRADAQPSRRSCRPTWSRARSSATSTACWSSAAPSRSGVDYRIRRGDGITLGEDEILSLADEDRDFDPRCPRPRLGAHARASSRRWATRGIEYVVLPSPADGSVASRLDATAGLDQASAEDRTTRAWRIDRPLAAVGVESRAPGSGPCCSSSRASRSSWRSCWPLRPCGRRRESAQRGRPAPAHPRGPARRRGDESRPSRDPAAVAMPLLTVAALAMVRPADGRRPRTRPPRAALTRHRGLPGPLPGAGDLALASADGAGRRQRGSPVEDTVTLDGRHESRTEARRGREGEGELAAGFLGDRYGDAAAVDCGAPDRSSGSPVSAPLAEHSSTLSGRPRRRPGRCRRDRARAGRPGGRAGPAWRPVPGGGRTSFELADIVPDPRRARPARAVSRAAGWRQRGGPGRQARPGRARPGLAAAQGEAGTSAYLLGLGPARRPHARPRQPG